MDVNRVTTILNVVRDPLPPMRADVATLFGKELVKFGFRTLLIGQSDVLRGEHLWAGGSLRCRGVAHGIWANAMAPLLDLISLIGALRQSTVDCIQVRDKIVAGIVCQLVAIVTEHPFVYWMSFPIVEGYESRSLAVCKSKGYLVWFLNVFRAFVSRQVFYGFVLPRAQHIFVQSEAMGNWLADKGINASRMTVVPMGVDTEFFNRECANPTKDDRLTGRRVIAYVGELGKARNSTFLLDVVLALKETEPTILLVLIGDAGSDDERVWIRTEIDKRALSAHVLLTGWLSRERALGYTVTAEVGLSPIPRGELFDVSSPTKLVEYMALGIPSVVNDIPDQKMVIEQSGAGICAPMEINAFRDAILTLLHDKKFHRQCAERGPPYIKAERSYEVIGRRVAKIYSQILMVPK